LTRAVIRKVDERSLTATLTDGTTRTFSVDSRTAVTEIRYVCVPTGVPRVTARKRVERTASRSDLRAGLSVTIAADDNLRRALKIRFGD
jgi:hypothetical protein